MNTSVVQALDALNIKEWTLQGKEPTNENEFNANFHKVIGEDETGSQIWENDPSKWDVTWSQVQAKQKEMDSDWIAQEYARKREAEYPSIEECVHAILDDDLTALQEKRQAIKTKYPKG
mgnify:CR=1 FL=1